MTGVQTCALPIFRPLAYVAEADLLEFSSLKSFPIIPCTLCGSQENLQRRQIGEMLRQWARNEPGRIESITRALTDVVPSHLLDRRLFDFAHLGNALKPSAGVEIKEPLFAEL